MKKLANFEQVKEQFESLLREPIFGLFLQSLGNLFVDDMNPSQMKMLITNITYNVARRMVNEDVEFSLGDIMEDTSSPDDGFLEFVLMSSLES